MRRRGAGAATLAAALVLAAPTALAVEFEHDGARWVCESLDARGYCTGKAMVVDPDGHLVSSRVRAAADGSPRWSGPLRERWPDGSVRRCAGTSPTLRLCVGATTDTGPDGSTVSGTREIQGEQSVWVGTIETRFASGSVERCTAAGLVTAACQGPTTFTWPDGRRRTGVKEWRDGRERWKAPVVETLPDGRSLHCGAVTDDGACDGPARWRLADGSERKTRFANGREVGPGR